MAVATNLSIVKAFEHLLTGKHVPTDATRLLGQQQVRALVEDRVFRGRKPQDASKDSILISRTAVEPEYLLSGEDDCPFSTLEVTFLFASAEKMDLCQDAARQLLTGLSGAAVETPAGTVTIANCELIDQDEPDPEPPADGSVDFQFRYIHIYRVLHNQTVPTGAS